MRLFKSRMVLHGAGLICLGLILASQTLQAQPPGGAGDGPREGRGPGGRRGGFPGMFDPQLSRELRNETFAAKMKITEEQQQKLNEIDMARREFFRSGGFRGGPPSEEFLAKIKEFETSSVNVLTPEQKTIWDARVVELKAEQATREAAAKASEGGAPRTDAPSTAGPVQPAAPQRRMVFTDEKPPEGATATATFGVRAAGSAAGVADSASGGASKDPADAANTKLSFNFRYAPWTDVLKLFADAANLTLDLNDVPPGTFNYYDDKTYTITEAMDVLNGYLLPKGYVLVRRDRFLVSLNIDNGIPLSLVPAISIDELSQRGANELVMVDVPVDGMEVDKIVGDIRALAGPWASVTPAKSTNSLGIMDTGSNIRRIVRLLKAGTAIESKETAFRAISLKNIGAADAERTVRRLFGLNPVVTSAPAMNGFNPFGGGQPGGFGPGQFGPGGFRGGGFDRGGDRGGDNRDPQQMQQRQPQAFPAMGGTQQTPSPYLGKILVTADTRTNHLLVTATSALVKVVEDTVKAIDVPQETPVAKNDSPVSVKAYPVPGGDPTQVAQTLSSIMPGVVAGIDTRSSKVYVQGTQEEHAEVEKLMKTLAGEIGGSVAVIPLMRLDPVQATNTLRNLFVTDPRPPTIEADAQGRRLLVRGSADQLAQVKVLLQQLGESGPNPHDEKVDGGPVRRGTFGPHDPNDILPIIRQIWNTADRAPIRVVIPSQPNPVRERRTPADRRPLDDAEANPPLDRAPAIIRPSSRPGSPPRDSSSPSTSLPRRPSILQVSESGGSRNTASSIPRILEVSTSALEQEAKAEETPSKEQPLEAPAKSVRVEPSTEKTEPLTISVLGGDYIITGGTSEERDRAEEMINTMTAALPVRTRWTIFYLRSADATETAQMLERLFPQSNVTSAPASSSGGLFGSFTGGLSQLGRGMMSSTGLNQTLGGANSLRIITDTRANALFVSGPQDQIREVEQMLEILDASELPDSLRSSVPRTIAVEYADVDDVAELLEDVFKDAMTPAAQGQQNQNQNPQRFNPLAMLMGGGAPAGGKPPTTQLTIGVDRRTSHLIVSCNDSMFRQVELVVKAADERARDARQTVRIVPLNTADPALIQSTLTSLMPKITVSTSRGSSQRRRQNSGGTPDPAQGQQQPPPGANDAMLFQRAAQQRAGANGGRPQNAGRPQNGGFPQQPAGGQGNRGGARRTGN